MTETTRSTGGTKYEIEWDQRGEVQLKTEPNGGGSERPMPDSGPIVLKIVSKILM